SSAPESKPALSSAEQTSSAPEQSSTPESKPEESSVPENKNEVDWDSVPYADELDFEVVDVDGGVKITNYLGSDTVIKIPETIDGKKVVAVTKRDKNDVELYPNFGTNYKVFNDKVTHVKLPDSVSDITHTFRGHSSLVSVNIPSSLTIISECAFYGCTAISSIEIPNTVTEIGYMAFAGSGLESLTVPDSVKAFDGSMISGCAKLKEVNLPQGIRVSSSYSYDPYFSKSKVVLIDLNFCAGLTNTDFLKNVKPSDAPDITLFAVSFGDCSSLTSITYPEGIECIETFGGCTSLTEITIPNSVTRVGYTEKPGDTDGEYGTLGVGGFGSNNPKKITLSDNIEKLDSITLFSEDTEIVYKGKTYKSNQLPNLYKAINGE
ncbi:MAG: leucine-rich repeat domain-containing protein, partial [Oscillospiraceae bacterium]|nr:leucine-rich repeat domain-containing protein [Oscillospiraceae bacterium]